MSAGSTDRDGEPSNVASVRLQMKLGFEQTAVLPGNDTIRGVLVDDWEFRRGASNAAEP